jgi:uncharacterized repeat protein (TIGR03943 family)
MTRGSQTIALTAVAALLLRLGLTGSYLLYVKPAMGPWLVAAGSLLAILAVASSLRDPGEVVGAAHDPHGRSGLLPCMLLLPAIVVFAIGPAPLGSFMAWRQATQSIETQQSLSSGFRYPPLPDPVEGVTDIDVYELTMRSIYDESREMEGVLLGMEGFVVPDPEGTGGTFLLTRFLVTCCAADGWAVQVRVHGVDPIPSADTWLRVEGYWVPRESDPERPDDFEVDSWEVIPVPEYPYL